MPLQQDQLETALSEVLLQEKVEGIDEDLVSYLAGLLADGLEDDVTQETVSDLMDPFLEACSTDVKQRANQVVLDMAVTNGTTNTTSSHTAVKLKQGLVSMSSNLSQQTDAEVEANRYLWGTDSGVAAMVNTTIDAYTEKTSSKDRRKAKQELEQARKQYQLQQQHDNDTDEGVVSNMVLPDYQSGRNERDVQVRNVSLSLDSGRSLLDHGELKFAHGRRYGLVGKNGVGA